MNKELLKSIADNANEALKLNRINENLTILENQMPFLLEQAKKGIYHAELKGFTGLNDDFIAEAKKHYDFDFRVLLTSILLVKW